MDKLTVELKETFDAYEKSVSDAVTLCISKFAARVRKNVRDTAPVGRRGGKRGGRRIDKGRSHFNQTVALKKEEGGLVSGSRFILHFRGAGAGLAHLLENPHVNRDGSIFPGLHFIRKALDKESGVLLENIKEAIGDVS